MSDPKSRLSTRVEVFTRATADALNRAIGEVLDARSPWQLLHRLSRIVFLGLVIGSIVIALFLPLIKLLEGLSK
jgi:type II secretory pathway component PulF